MANDIQQMECMLKPQGSKPVVRLFLKGSSYFDEKFVNACIKELKRLPIITAMGENISPLQKLGMIVLADSAYIDINDTERKENE